MLKTKYYDKINELNKVYNVNSVKEQADLEVLRSKGVASFLIGKIVGRPLWLLKMLRRVRPVLRIGDLYLLTRTHDVRHVLTNHETFETPYGLEISQLTEGHNVLLGMANGPDYQKQKRLVIDAFKMDGSAEQIKQSTAVFAEKFLKTQGERIDPIHGLFMGSVIQVCRDYYGLTIPSTKCFTQDALTMSNMLFADFTLQCM